MKHYSVFNPLSSAEHYWFWVGKRRQWGFSCNLSHTSIQYITFLYKYLFENSNSADLSVRKNVIVKLDLHWRRATRLTGQWLTVFHSAGLPSSISTSPSFRCSSACSTVMYPAGRQMLPVVAFQRRMRPSFPAEAKTVLVYHISNEIRTRV